MTGIEPLTLTVGGGIVLGCLLGFFSALVVLSAFYKDTVSRIDHVTAQYVYILNCFGIKRENGVWKMYPKDRNEIWIKKDNSTP